MTLCVIVLTKNSAAFLDACLKSAKFADELIIIDDCSTDRTIKIAQKHTSLIYPHGLSGDWATQRNFAFSKTKTDWVMFLDSDETISPALQKEIFSAIQSNQYNGFYLRRQDYFLGSPLKHGETTHVRLLRLAKHQAGHWVRPVHEVWQVKGPIGSLHFPLLHHRDLSISDLLTRLNYYTDLEVSYQKAPFSFLHLFKPPLKFAYNYFFLLGFLDGFPGFVFAFLMSLHSLSVRIKHWQKHD